MNPNSIDNIKNHRAWIRGGREPFYTRASNEKDDWGALISGLLTPPNTEHYDEWASHFGSCGLWRLKPWGNGVPEE